MRTLEIKENMRKHNPNSPFLIGGYMPGDIVREATQKSWIDRQIRLAFESECLIERPIEE